MAREVSEAGVRLVQEFEGCRLDAYRCPAGIPTIGYGATGPDIRMGMVWTQEQADERLAEDLARFAAGVERLVQVDLTDNQFAALVSFAYNVGLGALAGSTLLRKLNAGDYEGAADQFPRWNKGGGRVLPGLVRRRAAERDLFLSDA
ncbi:MAG: lysozyme [Gemmatimonadetes bacterium]|nr:lysozyme [Gemmatimonadota bacterium]